MIFSEKLKLAYYPVPKAACSSIKHAFLVYHGFPPTSLKAVHSLLPEDVVVEVKDNNLRRVQWSRVPVKPPSHLKPFAVVRNPEQRIISFFKDKISTGKARLWPNMKGHPEDWFNFKAWVIHKVKTESPYDLNIHMRPQVHLVHPYARVLKFESNLSENLQRDFRLSIAHINKSAYTKPLAFTPNERQALERAYHEDYETFGY